MNLTQAEAQCALFAALTEISDLVRDLGRLRGRSIYGGVFGSGQFVLCSTPWIANGLDAVFYIVRDLTSGAVVAAAHSKADCLRMARACLESADPLQLAAFFGAYRAAQERAAAEMRQRMRDEEAERFAAEKARRPKVGNISRRRRSIFDECAGKCHYCGTALTLDGKWHVEHKFPVALGGTNAPNNLVASCVPCNHEKRDTTDIEFKAKRAAKEKA